MVLSWRRIAYVGPKAIGKFHIKDEIFAVKRRRSLTDPGGMRRTLAYKAALVNTLYTDLCKIGSTFHEL
jgi:hypothetical protein